MKNIQKQQHNGVKYYHYILRDNWGVPKKFDGVLCFGKNDRFTLKGDFVLTLTNGSYKYDHQQIQFRIRSPCSDFALKHDQRVVSNWDTHDIYLPISEIPEIIKALQSFLLLAEQNNKK